MSDGRTHWDECWRDHHACAVARIEDVRREALRRIEAALNASGLEWETFDESIRLVVADQMEQARLNGMGSQREARLQARIAELAGLAWKLRSAISSLAHGEHSGRAYANEMLAESAAVLSADSTGANTQEAEDD